MTEGIRFFFVFYLHIIFLFHVQIYYFIFRTCSDRYHTFFIKPAFFFQTLLFSMSFDKQKIQKKSLPHIYHTCVTRAVVWWIYRTTSRAVWYHCYTLEQDLIDWSVRTTEDKVISLIKVGPSGFHLTPFPRIFTFLSGSILSRTCLSSRTTSLPTRDTTNWHLSV